MPGADDVLTFYLPADTHVGAEVLTVGVQRVHFAGGGAEQHQLLTEVVRALDLTDLQVRCEGDDEPSGREPVRGQCNAALPELLLRWVFVLIRLLVRVPIHEHSVPHAAERTWAALNSPRFDDLKSI